MQDSRRSLARGSGVKPARPATGLLRKRLGASKLSPPRCPKSLVRAAALQAGVPGNSAPDSRPVDVLAFYGDGLQKMITQ